MSAYDDQDMVLSRRLRELVRLAGAGELQDVSSEPGGPYELGMHLNGHNPGGRGAAPVAAHEQGGPGTGPEEPGLPDGPHAPETPHAPDAPHVPESPEFPPHEAPESPDLPDLPGVPDVPEVDGPAEMPEIPGAPDVLRSPEIPPTPDIPPAPHVPDMPDVPEAPEIPESPGIHDEPEIPEPPRIDDPDLPELDRPVDLPGPPADLPGAPGDPSAPDAPDVPRPPDLPDPPHSAPGGPDAVLDAVAASAVTAMHSNHTYTMRFPDEPGPSGLEQPERRHGSPQEWGEGAAVPPPAPGGNGGQGSGGGLRGTGGGGSGGDGEHGPAGDGGHDGDDSEVEAELRRMLHQSVRGIEPAPEALTHLKHAVPARRAHRRRALAGAAAAVVLVGVGFPGLVNAGLIPGIEGGSSINAGEGNSQAQSVGGANGTGNTQGPGSGSGGASGNGGKSGGGDGSASPSPTQGAGSEGGDPNDTLATSAPSCGRQQLGDGSAATESPDSEGKVYGSFRVVNTSSDACTVEGEGIVGASAHGRADIERIDVLDHTAGDAATALPDPALAASELVLKPGQAYEVKWAWVPKDCEPSGDPEPKAQEGNGPEGSQGGNNGNPGGNDSGGSNGNSGGDDAGGNSSNSGGDGGESDEEASVVLSHTPDVGDPAAANTELEGACAGTLYRTGVLAAD
ncbi:hypothetical protein G4Z16_14445 [Streptomyces bathyalis]|uniref:DUF4232 domain-containing protein n=1 Tax=Streptomyces bathyalis TaxID=2710756 RepID=A0A7T1T6P6_9ACTN|nr:hypothetical protein [Streptomyces bathyalis]QPP07384.1 hypothetical protein G4Z16_14445 [Streptomyces bathyalis]